MLQRIKHNGVTHFLKMEYTAGEFFALSDVEQRAFLAQNAGKITGLEDFTGEQPAPWKKWNALAE